jgi:hypothetical protein
VSAPTPEAAGRTVSRPVVRSRAVHRPAVHSRAVDSRAVHKPAVALATRRPRGLEWRS